MTQHENPKSILYDSEEYIESLSKDLQKVREKAITLRAANSRDILFMERKYHVGVEYTSSRFDYFLKWMTKAGVLTDEQFWQMNLDWELEFQEQIQQGMAAVESDIRKQALAQGQPDPTKQRPNGLIVPGQ